MSELAERVVQAWTLPTVSGPTVGRPRGHDGRTPERDAFDKGFAQGREAGFESARREQEQMLGQLRAQVARLDEVLAALSDPLRGLEGELHEELARLAMAVARQLVRRELRHQPDQIVAVIRETLALLPGAVRDARIHLHPDDAAIVRERLVEPNTRRAWALVEDPVISRGGCRITSGNSSIDAQVESRIGAAIAAVLGDERASGVAP